MRGDALGDSFNIRIRACIQLDQGQGRVAASSFSKRAREQRMASIGPNPSRQLAIQLAARIGGSTRGRRAAPSLELSAPDQFPRDLSA